MNQPFTELGLSAELLKAIDKLGFEKPSPIQAEAIPALLQGRDVVGQSQTGSGKTVAFAAPAIERLEPAQKVVQVLILCPTRELTMQVAEEVHKLAVFKRGVHALPIFGGQSYDRQFYGLKQGVQIVIGTPGRTMDHMRRGTLRLDSVRMVILDEADVMLDMGFREDMETILKAVPAGRQTVFFSATMPRPIRELIGKFSRDPVTLKIEHKTVTVPTVDQLYYEVDSRFKRELLTRLIDIHDFRIGIVFCNTKRMVDELAEHLNALGYSADRLHGDMSQAMRDRVMTRFRKAQLEFLIATDVAARGIDVQDVQVVFNYDLPYDVEDYVHRIGRTGRAGKQGRAISFVSRRELFLIQQIQRFTRTRIQREEPPSAQAVEEARAAVFLDQLRATLQSDQLKSPSPLIQRLEEEGFSSADIAAALLYHLQGETLGLTRSSSKSHTTSVSVDRPTEPFKDSLSSKPRETLPAAVNTPKHRKPASEKHHQVRRELNDLPKPPPRPRNSKTAMVRLFMNIGAESGITESEVLRTISGETGLAGDAIGRVDIRDRHLFVEVVPEHAQKIKEKLNRTQIRGQRVKVKLA